MHISRTTYPARAQTGITGLETAIILIAFVVVAAVFAFTVLSLGVFSAERSKETIHAGLDETTSTLNPKGGMIAITGDVSGTDGVAQVKFVVTQATTGDVADLTPPYLAGGSGTDPDASSLESKLVVSYTDSGQHINELAWTVQFTGSSNGDYLLDKDEQAEITVWLHQQNTSTGDYVIGTAGSSYLSTRLGINTRFTITVNSEKGATFSMERRVPPRLNAVMDLR